MSDQSGETFSCVVYKGRKKTDAYLFVERGGDFARVPESLLKMLGDLEFVMNLVLEPGRKLAQADAATVIRHVRAEGFYLQMPRDLYRSID